MAEIAPLFRDRVEAGCQLAQKLMAFAGRPNVIVLGLPRGGVPVAEQVAGALDAELDVFVVRKVGVPGREELAMGAVASGGVCVINREVVEAFGIGQELLLRAAAAEVKEVARRERFYRGDRPLVDLTGKTVILVDDGLATGASMRAAVESARVHRVARAVVAVPVAPPSSCEELRSVADAVICVATPEAFFSVGQWYEDFWPTSDDEVRETLARRARPVETMVPTTPRSTRGTMAGCELEVSIPVDRDHISGTLVIPDEPRGLVLFAHGSGSSRFSPRNRFVAESLQHARFGTLLLDLLTPAEERVDAATGRLRFDIELLANRVTGATDWLLGEQIVTASRLGYFGASTGAAAALIAAAERPSIVGAVVSRGGRPDLAGEALGQVRAPTLFIVGGEDTEVLELNQEARRALGAARTDLQIVPGATHLFEEPGALKEVARLAIDWFEQSLAPSREETSHASV